MPGCQVTLGLQALGFQQAKAAGAKTLIIGIANRSGVIEEEWFPAIQQALQSGLDVASGLHQRLNEIEMLVQMAEKYQRKLLDIRYPTQPFLVATGAPRSGKRLLTVGTDCTVGKMYTALAIAQALQDRGADVDFRATGQTGILISGSGISVDAVIADFISGAIEALAPANHADHWDIIEGQGSLFHPSYAGVSLGLLHGAQANALVLCHEAQRKTIRKLEHQPIPSIEQCLQTYLEAARLTVKDPFFAGIAINTAALDEATAQQYLQACEQKYNLPCVDPVRTGVDAIVEGLGRA